MQANRVAGILALVRYRTLMTLFANLGVFVDNGYTFWYSHDILSNFATEQYFSSVFCKYVQEV